MQKAFKYRFYPTPEQENLLRRTMGCTRLIYNKALALRTDAYYQEQRRIGYLEISKALTNWKQQQELAFLKDVSSVPLQQSLRCLQIAFTNLFECGTSHDRDLNAAVNILAVGQTVLACGATVRPKVVTTGGRCHEAGSPRGDSRKTKKPHESS